MARWLALAIATLLAFTTPPMVSAVDDEPISAPTDGAIFRAFSAGDFDEALTLIQTRLRTTPDDVTLLYNAACACAQLGRRDDGGAYLLKAVRAGFRDFKQMERDPDLAPLRDHPVFEAILEARDRAHRNASDDVLKSWKDVYGTEGYQYDRDDSRRLVYAAALDEEAFRAMRGRLDSQADHLIERFFEAPPDYPVLIAVPKPAQAQAILKDIAIGGIYEHPKRRLLARDIGSALQHEFVHLLHYGHMERLGQQHPLWLQEGLASLFESYDLLEDGTAKFHPNGRHNVARNNVRAGRAMKWEAMFELPGERFMRVAGKLYPQVRSMFEFIAEEGKLEDWYRTYVEKFDEDPTGRLAMEIVFDAPIRETERRWRRWVLARPPVDTRIDQGDASLGIATLYDAVNDGVLITEHPARGTSARDAGLRKGDVIVSIDDRPTPSVSELVGLIATRTVGDRVELRVRRGGEYLTVTATLKAMR